MLMKPAVYGIGLDYIF